MASLQYGLAMRLVYTLCKSTHIKYINGLITEDKVSNTSAIFRATMMKRRAVLFLIVIVAFLVRCNKLYSLNCFIKNYSLQSNLRWKCSGTEHDELYLHYSL